jgi:hypothetical protein
MFQNLRILLAYLTGGYLRQADTYTRVIYIYIYIYIYTNTGRVFTRVFLALHTFFQRVGYFKYLGTTLKSELLS